MKSINVIVELILNIFGFTLSSRRVNNIFKTHDITDIRINKIKSNLDNKSIEVIDACD